MPRPANPQIPSQTIIHSKFYTRPNDYVWVYCHCGDKYVESVGAMTSTCPQNGHRVHFPTLYRAWLEVVNQEPF